MRRLLFVAAMFLLLSAGVIAEDALEVNKVYRAKVNLTVEDANQNYLIAGSKSKFRVIDASDDNSYAVSFTKVYKVTILNEDFVGKSSNEIDSSDSLLKSVYSGVVSDEIYYLPKKFGKNNINTFNSVEESFGGFVSGPLIVPFKYRFDDKSITGDATIGYYAGYGWDVLTLNLVPFLSGGISQVSVSTTAEDGSVQSDNKTGFTVATGFLIKNWDKVNIGLVFGQDRIGNKNWEHEGEWWFSFSVGWEL